MSAEFVTLKSTNQARGDIYCVHIVNVQIQDTTNGGFKLNETADCYSVLGLLRQLPRLKHMILSNSDAGAVFFCP